MQRRFWNFKDDDLTADINRWLTGLHPSGLYFGFEFLATGDLVLNLEHTVTQGFKYVDDLEAESNFQGMIITRQGTVIVEDATIQIAGISAGDPTNPRIDTIIITHEYLPTTGGGTALYSVIEGTPAGSPSAPALADPLRQLKIGELYIPANITLLTDGGVVFTREPQPKFANGSQVVGTASRALETDGSGLLVASVITAAELNYLDGVSSSIQTQLGGKQATITGGATTITSSDLTASRALVSSGSGKVAVSAVTAATLAFLDASSSVQNQLNAKQATITGGATTITSSNLTINRALISDGSGKVAVSAVTSTEISYLDNVTSAIQTQLGGKQATITGGATTITGSNLTASRALVSDGSGKVGVSAVTSAEIAHLDGVTSALQTQMNARARKASAESISGAWTFSTAPIMGTVGISEGGTIIRRKLVQIGTWNMDSTLAKMVDVGVDEEDILGIDVIIYGDTGASQTEKPLQWAGSDGLTDGSYNFQSSQNVQLVRRANPGAYDHANYDSTTSTENPRSASSRGHIVVTYI